MLRFDLEQKLREAIEALVNPTAQPRLLRALPSLLEGVVSWGGLTSPLPGRDSLYVAAATREGSIVFPAGGWPAYDQEQAARLSRGDLAVTLCTSLTRAPTNDVTSNILTALTVLMGPEAVERQKHDTQRIRSGGGVPLVAALLDPHGNNVAMFVTTVAVPRPTVH